VQRGLQLAAAAIEMLAVIRLRIELFGKARRVLLLGGCRGIGFPFDSEKPRRWRGSLAPRTFQLRLHFRHQLCLPFGKFLADGVNIHLCRLEFREKLFFLFFDVLLDHFTEDSNLGVVELLADLHRLDLADQVFHSRVLDNRFVDQIVILTGLARLWVEDFFFDLGVDLQGEADLFRELGLAIVVTVLQLVILVEPFFDFLVILFQDVERVTGRLLALFIPTRSL
jgi:hypothetical protein